MRTKDVMIIGAGKIGRGFLADRFTEEGFHLVLVNGRPDTIDALRKAGQYTIFTTEKGHVSKKIVTDFEAWSSTRDFSEVVRRLSEIDLACVALYPTSYDSVADVIAAATRKRRIDGVDRPLNIMLFVNYVFSARILREKTLSRLIDEADKAYFASHIGIFEALTARNGSQPTPEMLAEDPLCVSTGPGYILPVGDEFIGGRPDGIACMQFLDKIEGRLVKKVWCGNMQHCTLANMGLLRGLTYVYQSADDPYIRKCVNAAADEACFAVAKAYDFSEDDMADVRRRDWDGMRANPIKDTMLRVAADPLRKLSRNERYIGPALLCLQYGRVPFFLARGAAYELLFENPNDPSAVKMHALIQEKGLESALWEITGLDAAVPHENALHQLIVAQYREITQA